MVGSRGTAVVLGALVASALPGCGRPGPSPGSAPSPQPVVASSAASPGRAPVGERAKPESSPPTRTATLAEVGLDPASIDRSADPCVDFYQFACGGWHEAATVPPDTDRWDRFRELDQRNRQALLRLLEDTRPQRDATVVALRTFYAACADEAAADAAGTSAIDSLLTTARKVRDPASLSSALAELHLRGIAAVFRPSPAPDPEDPERQILLLDGAGLGLPDRVYYLVGREDHDPVRAAYGDYLRTVFGLLGMKRKQARRAAADVIAIETALAQATKSQVERRMLDQLHHRVDRKGLAELAPRFDWNAYLGALRLPRPGAISVTTPKLFRRFDVLLARFEPAAWSHYLVWHIVNATASALPRRFAEAQRTFEAKALGRTPLRSRRERCLDETASAMGEALGAAYAGALYDAGAAKEATHLLEELRATMRTQLQQATWLGATTREAALAKLDRGRLAVGLPQANSGAETPTLRPAAFAANLLAARAARTRSLLARVGKRVDRGQTELPQHHASASYNWLTNQLAVPTGFLQPPFFSVRHTTTVNLGAMGATAAHELTHAYDELGALLDGDGKLQRWWRPEDARRFRARSRCLMEQLSATEAWPGVRIDGRRALAETLADLVGVRVAFETNARLAAAADGAVAADGFSEAQQFFLAVGQAWCGKERRADQTAVGAAAPRPPARVRVNLPLSNLAEFSAAFSCKAGAPMRREKPCSIW